MAVLEEIHLSVDLVRAARRSEMTPKDLTTEDLMAAEERYRRFLALKAKYRDRELSPTKDIDLMWHLHMLSPRHYLADCTAIFGALLDHDGGFGATPDELPVLQQIAEETAGLWEKEFGESYHLTSASVVNCKDTVTCKGR